MDPPNPAAGGPAARILVVDADVSLLALLDQWLAVEGSEVVHQRATDSDPQGPIDLAIVDVPQPRLGAAQAIARIVGLHPDTPILAVSSAFFPGIERCSTAAQALGVSGVLAKPMSREALVAKVRALLK